MTKIMRTLRDVSAEIRSESQSTQPVGLTNDYTYGNLNSEREELEDKASHEELIEDELMDTDDVLVDDGISGYGSQPEPTKEVQNTCVPGSDYLGGSSLQNDRDLTKNGIADTTMDNDQTMDTDQMIQRDMDQDEIVVERDIIITEDEVIDITMVSVPDEEVSTTADRSSDSQPAGQAPHDKIQPSSTNKRCGCGTNDKYKELDDATLDKMKERYPVEQVLPDEDEVLSVKEVQPSVDEMNVDKNTRERG
ncbi:MAG: hypothetical protein LUG51_11270 [Tannerellaceae bacterium]|nr:hypothetical protein [Tannerellaceae bacterium]